MMDTDTATLQPRTNDSPLDEADEDRNVASGAASDPTWRQYHRYELEVDEKQNDRASEIRLCSLVRPHMRNFHYSWWSFFSAFFIWFSIVPLLGEIQTELNLTKYDLWASRMAGLGGTVLIRLILGPLCDMYGARVLMALVLCTAAIPTACTGLINSATGLLVVRFLIGIAGGSFVMCEYWTSKTFTNEIVGTANALAAGWGNLGGGVTELIIGTILFPAFKSMYGGDASMAWRTVCIVPAIIAFVSGVAVYLYSDDSPKGNYSELKKRGIMKPVNGGKSLWVSATCLNTWLLAFIYACCFGVELTMNQAGSQYFRDRFGQSTETAAAISSMFGWLNLFSRGLGGILSDVAMARFSMKGRLWVLTILLAAQGAFVLIFANTSNLGGAIGVLIVFSFFTQASSGAVFGIVPYVVPSYIGSVTGIIGAGGNCGALVFSTCFQFLDFQTAFSIMGGAALGSACLSPLIQINGFKGCLWGRNRRNVNAETGSIHSSTRGSQSGRSGSDRMHSVSVKSKRSGII